MSHSTVQPVYLRSSRSLAPAELENARTEDTPLAIKVRELFGVDLRSLAVFRIALGLIVLVDLAYRLPYLTAFYSDRGVLPRWPLLDQFLNANNLSIHLISGQAWVQGVLFAIHGLFALAMVVGYRSRLATVLTWAMLISLHARNSVILHGGDVLLRMLLFWAMFLPVGARLSFDVATGRVRRGANWFISPATFGLLLQVSLMYVISALYKSDPIWRDGYAIFYALQIDQFATPFGHWLLNFPTVLRAMTFFVWYAELLGPLLVFAPFFTWQIRVAMILLFWGLHAGMGTTLELGNFPWVCGTAWLAFLPTAFWDRVLAIPRVADLRLLATREFDRIRLGIEKLYSPLKPTLHPVDQNAPHQPSPVNSLLAMGFVLYIWMWNLRGFSAYDYAKFLPDDFNVVAQLTWVDQQWSMFAPRPMGQDGWYVMPGKLVNGREIDVFKDGAPVDWTKPEYVSRTYVDTRWRKYMLNLWLNDGAKNRLWYARYLTGQWNSTHEGGEQLETFKIIFMRQDTTADGVRPQPTPVEIWEHWCFK